MTLIIYIYIFLDAWWLLQMKTTWELRLLELGEMSGHYLPYRTWVPYWLYEILMWSLYKFELDSKLLGSDFPRDHHGNILFYQTSIEQSTYSCPETDYICKLRFFQMFIILPASSAPDYLHSRDLHFFFFYSFAVHLMEYTFQSIRMRCWFPVKQKSTMMITVSISS